MAQRKLEEQSSIAVVDSRYFERKVSSAPSRSLSGNWQIMALSVNSERFGCWLNGRARAQTSFCSTNGDASSKDYSSSIGLVSQRFFLLV